MPDESRSLSSLDKPVPGGAGDTLARPRPDWRDPAAYAYTRTLTRDAWAWEFLRRSPNYRAAFVRSAEPIRRARHTGVRQTTGVDEAAQRWGCFPFENPDRNASQAAVMWRPDVSSFVLRLRAEAELKHDVAPSFAGLRDKATAIVSMGTTQHVLFMHNGQRLQLAVCGGDLFTAQRIFTDIASPRLKQGGTMLRRFNRLAARGDLGETVSAPAGCGRRLLFVLRALDGASAGASQQEIAEALFESRDIKRDWDSPTGALRHQVRRAIYRGSWLRDGGYLRLLR